MAADLTIKLPDWLSPLTRRDERLRAAHGLTPKSDGWYKSIGGKTRYIYRRGPVADAIKALPAKQRQFAAGDRPAKVVRVQVGRLTIERLAEMFLADCHNRMTTGTPKPMERRTYEDYVDVLSRFCAVVGLARPADDMGPDDFTSFVRTLDGRSGTTLRREIQYVDRLFNWAGPGKRSMNLIPFAQRGPNWVKPEGVGEADKAYTLEQLGATLAAVKADPLLVAAWHLGFGSGFIPIDVAELREDQVDLSAGIILFPRGRGKTGEDRLCPLHPEGVAALTDYLASRTPKCAPAAAGLFFRTRKGLPLARWHEGKDGGPSQANLVKTEWGKAIRAAFGLGANLPFTGLRTTLASLLDDWADQRAVDVILGHKSGEKAKHIRSVHYARQFSPDRARRAVEFAYAQVFFGPHPSLPSPRFLSDLPAA